MFKDKISSLVEVIFYNANITKCRQNDVPKYKKK